MPNASVSGELLTYIVTQGGATVATLVDALGLADATARRHLARLETEKLISSRSVRQSTGRPFHIYEATAAGVRRQRDHSSDLATRLLSQVAAGGTDLKIVAEGLADQVATDHRNYVSPEDPLETRVVNTVRALQGEGILDSWERTRSGYRLHNHGCPYQSAAAANDCLCESDRLTIEKLVGTEVKQLSSLARGDSACEYVVEEAPVSGAELPILQRKITKRDTFSS